MALFGRRRRQDDVEDDLDDRAYADDDEYAVVGGDLFDGAGPWDEEDAPEDGMHRLDLGSVRLPVPDGAQLQVEMDPAGPVKAVHVVTPVGQLTVTAYAAPRSGGLWHEVSTSSPSSCSGRRHGAHHARRVGPGAAGRAGRDAAAVRRRRRPALDAARRRGRPPDRLENSTAALYELVRGTVVVRGVQPMPVRTPLPIELPPAIAQHIQQTQDGPA